jgi:hypothetical protein
VRATEAATAGVVDFGADAPLAVTVTHLNRVTRWLAGGRL